MGTFDDDEDELEDMEDSMQESESLGVDDADALVSLDLLDDSEEVGLDTEVGLVRDLGDVSSFIDADDESDGDPLENDPLDGFDGELDDDADEHGWTQDSEGAGDAWEGETLEDDEESHEDDGGVEGVDDPLLEDWVADLPALSEDPDLEEGDTLVDDLGDDWIEKVGRVR
jgi:hypothetical protein